MIDNMIYEDFSNNIVMFCLEVKHIKSLMDFITNSEDEIEIVIEYNNRCSEVNILSIMNLDIYSLLLRWETVEVIKRDRNIIKTNKGDIKILLKGVGKKCF